jgi:hypothetical protein
VIKTRAIRALVVGAATLLATGLATHAEAHGRGHGHGPVIVGGFYAAPWFGWGWGPYWGSYWGPWIGPYGLYPQGGIDPNVAMMAGVGAIDLNVKPGRAELWVDGRYYGEARDFDGYPTFLWLPEGSHQVTLYKGGYQRFDETIDVQRGLKRELKVRLEKGESQAPGLKPGEKPANTPAEKPADPSAGKLAR